MASLKLAKTIHATHKVSPEAREKAGAFIAEMTSRFNSPAPVRELALV